jgi:hypothetical protein
MSGKFKFVMDGVDKCVVFLDDVRIGNIYRVRYGWSQFKGSGGGWPTMKGAAAVLAEQYYAAKALRAAL